MTDDSSQATGTETVLAALAVLGRADATQFAVLLDHDDMFEHSAHYLAALSSHPAVEEQEGEWVLEPDTASAILADLERDDLSLYRLLHERAVAHMADRLLAGNRTAEPTFVAVLNRLANRLLSDDPAGLATLIDSVRDIPLSTPAGRQRRRYFEGLALVKTDRYAEALAVFDALLAEPGLDEWVRGRTLNSRANCCRIIGRLEEAVIDFRASLELWRRLDEVLREGLALLNLGIVAYQLQDYEQAESDLHQAAHCFEEAGSPQWLAAAQNELGLVYRDQGHWAEALACFEAAAAQRRLEGAQDSLGRALNNIGEIFLFQGRLQEAAAAFREALSTMTTRVYAVDAHLNLGLVQQIAGDLQCARAAFQEALDLALDIGRRDILPEAHYRLGEVLHRLGDELAALAQFKAGAEVIEATREPLRDEELKISLLGRWQQVYEALVLHCLALGRGDEAFDWAERARARAFADAVVQGQLSPEEMDPSGDSDRPLAGGVARAAEVRAGLPADAALLCYFTTGVLERDLPLLRALSADDPLREHLLTPARTLLFVLTRDDLTVHECPIDPNAFATASPRYSDRSRFLVPAALRRLYDFLLKPAGDALAASRLYLLPHGPLHRVPFGALTDESGQPLLRAGGSVLVYAPSATVLLRYCLAPPFQESAPEPCLAVGYDGTTHERALRHTEAEATFVARLTKGTVLVGPQTKKGQLRVMASDHRWLHFACHGRFNDEAPLDSYLETGAGQRLTAQEVLQSWRLRAELVILSACQTGVSRILRGDEPMGLIRAFLYVGARAVLASQWPVGDLPTFLLMQHFYGELQRAHGADPSAALHAAQVWLQELTMSQVRELLGELPVGDPRTEGGDSLAGLPPEARPFAHPCFWAPFVLVGA